jgi:hypothetical protein
MVSKERQSLTESGEAGESLSFRSSASSFFSIYQRIDSINDFLDNLVYEFPNLVSTFSIGKSYEGRDLRLIKISSVNFQRLEEEEHQSLGDNNNATSDKRHSSNDNHRHHPKGKSQQQSRFSSLGKKREAIYLDGGFHAREWISVTTACFLASKLPADYTAGDPGVRKLLDHYDVYILPVANPDGYEYTHTKDRLWRKTRSRHLPYGISLFGCRGVDPNRNFDFHWNEVGSSDNPCTDVYAGPRAFSEPETKAVADFLLAHKDQIKMFFALHSYGELWLTPWGKFTNTSKAP